MLQKLFLLLWSIGTFAQAPTFDGVITAEEWKNAQQFSLDYEIEPSNNGTAQFKTDVFVTHTKTDIYIGFIAYADMENIRSSIRSRDRIGNDDNVAIGLDTYGDGRYMTVLGANPEGNQFDLKILPNGNEDAYDVTFETKASKHENAYHVEFKIPVNGLQFKHEETMEWAVVFGRSGYDSDTRIQMLNFPIDRSNPCIVCQTPDKIKLQNLTPSKRLNLIPYVFVGQSGSRENDNFVRHKTKGNIGLSGLLDLSHTTTLEFALNPDFSQIEADVSQIDANNTFALFFPERRPYFNEGNDIINSNQQAVYTRSINNPLASTKLIHQGEKQRLYWLTGYDENTPYLVAGENQSYSGEGNAAWANILAYQRTYKGGSHVGLLTTNRFFKDGGNGQLIGLNSQIRFADIYTAKLEWNFSNIKEPANDWIDSNKVEGAKTVALDGEIKKGNGLFLALDRNTKNWNTFFYYAQYSPNFETPLGFVAQNNLRNSEIIHQYVAFPKDKKARIQQFNTSLGTEITYNYSGLRKYFDVFNNTYIAWKGNWKTELNIVHIIDQEYEGFKGKNMSKYSIWNSYNPNETIRLGVFSSLGNGIRFDEDNPSVGKQLSFGTFNNFQLSEKLRISQSLRYSQMRSKTDNRFFYKGYILRLIANYQFNKDLSFRFIGEYNEFDDKLFFQPLLKWNPNPFTLFFIGGSHGYNRPENNNSLRLENSQVYLKFQYLFDI